MSRNRNFISKSLVAAAVLGLSAYGVAFADDSSMSMWTGDSYAFFNNLDYSAGHFNIARAPKTADDMAAKAPAKAPEADGHRPMTTSRLPKGMATNPFRTDTGA